MLSTPHTNTAQDVNSAQDDLDPTMNPQDSFRADPELYENSDGAQTAGNRSFHTTAGRDNQPKSFDEGTENTPSDGHPLPQGDAPGITNSGGNKERETQEKVINS